MRILWITETLLTEGQNLLTHNTNAIVTRGWLEGQAKSISHMPGIEIVVAAPSNQVKQITKVQGEHICYYAIPLIGDNRKYNSHYEKIWIDVDNIVKPDIVHLHGTEYAYSLAYLKACGNKKVVASIQGLISEIAKYYCSGISIGELIRHHTVGDFLFGLSILQSKRQFQKRGEIEKQAINSLQYVIGRTNWDRVHSLSINPHLHYFFNNESLRDVFYEGKWNYDNCIHHSIFLSQSTYPVKGLHFVLKALTKVIKVYPNTSIRIAGRDITQKRTIKDRLLYSQYNQYIEDLIRKHHLENHICFTGALSASQIKAEYLKSNVFILPSTIENSSNSLGEAQILGVPCIASFVGGIPDLVPNSNCGKLYRYDDIDSLADLIISIFDQSCCFDNTEMVKVANERHDRTYNGQKLIDIYKTIIQQQQWEISK